MFKTNPFFSETKVNSKKSNFMFLPYYGNTLNITGGRKNNYTAPFFEYFKNLEIFQNYIEI